MYRAALQTSEGVAMLFPNDKIITRRMRRIGGRQGREKGRERGGGGGARERREEDDHAEFSFKTSLRICAFANFGRRLDARLFIPAALRFAPSTSLFAHLYRSSAPSRNAREKIRTLQNDYLSKRSLLRRFYMVLQAPAAGIKSRRYLYFFSALPPPPPPLSLPLFSQVSILISTEYTPSRRHAKIARVFLREVCANEIVDIRQTRA